MAFEKYTKGNRLKPGAGISVSVKGAIGLNAKAAMLLGGKTHVVLYYDKDSKEIGIEPTSEKEDSAFKVSKNGSARVVYAIGFFNEYGLLPSELTHLDVEWVIKDGKKRLMVADAKKLIERNKP